MKTGEWDEVAARMWSIRRRDEQDGYEIVAPRDRGGQVVDIVTLRELHEAEKPHDLMRYRIEKAQGLHRVRRFAEFLRADSRRSEDS